MKKCKECGREEWGFLSALNKEGYCPRCAIRHNEEKIKMLQEQLKETQQELQVRINDNADIYAKLCNALMQLEEANDVIKGYADAYKKYPDGTMMTFVVNKHPAHHYLDRWGIK